VSKTVTLGDGNDTVTLASGTTAVTGSINGGNGTDTLSMVAADAVTASGTTLFSTKVTGFEVLNLTGGTGAQTVKVDQLGSFNAVTSGGEAAGGVLTMDGFLTGGSLTLTADSTGSYVVSSSAWATPTNDTFNIALSNAGAVAGGSVKADNVESLTISANDTTANVKAGATADSLTLVATKATALTVTGNTTLTLTVTSDTALTSVDASGMTGGLTLTTAGTVAETVKGGASANALTAAAGTQADVLIGGASADVLTSNAGLTTLTGGAGNDVFVTATAGANVNTYTTITDASAGDRLVLAHATTSDSFNTTKVVLGDTAVFQDYANAVVNAGGDASTNAKAGWFQFNGNTYVVESLHNASTTANFTNGTDLVVKLSGFVDLSHASFNSTYTELLIG
jgi:S-layer protein